MANNITGNPWYVDSVGTLITTRFKFQGGIWNGAAATNTITFTDNTGRFVFKAVFPTDLVPVQIPNLGWVNGLICTTITGGNATITVGHK